LQHSWQNRDKAAPSNLQWSGIQVLLEQAESDVLILLDCCASGTANSGEGNGASELISACAYNATANGVGPYSFTSALVIELYELSKKSSFSVGELYSNIFIRSQSRMPEDGQERHPAPVHLVLTRSNEFPRSIQLSQMRIRVENSSIDEIEGSLNDSTALPSVLHAGQWTARSSNSSHLIEIDDVISPTPSISFGGRMYLERNSVPRLAFAVRLNESFETGELSIDAFVEWLRTIPTLVEDVKIEAGFESFSSLLIMSLPIALSSYLPRNPAIFSLGPIKSSNKIVRQLDDVTGSSEISSQLAKAIPRMQDNYEMQMSRIPDDDVSLGTSSSTPAANTQALIPSKTDGRGLSPEFEDKSAPPSSLETIGAHSYRSTGASLFPRQNYGSLAQYLSQPMADQTRNEAIGNSEALPLLPTSPEIDAPSTDLTMPVIYHRNDGKEAPFPGAPTTDNGRKSSLSIIDTEASPEPAINTAISEVADHGRPDGGCQKHYQGIYWRPPTAMVFLLLGLTLIVAQYLYYSHLSGKRVGGDWEQQWALRLEAFFCLIYLDKHFN
jgi:hypothetical protein